MAEKKDAPTRRKESRRLRRWLSREDPVSIATHQRVDADAAFSAALLHILRPHASIAFVRADSIITAAESLAVDLSEGPRAVKGLKTGSAFGLIVSVLQNIDRPVHDALSRWASQLNKTDSGKKCRDKVVLAELVTCWRTSGLQDEQIVQRAEELLQGKILSHKRRMKHRETARQVPTIGRVAVVSPGTHVKAIDLFREGAMAVVRESDIGMCVNLSREAIAKGISLTEFEGLLPPDWFIHPQGFLACYGSVKAPKDPVDSGLSLEQLVKIVHTWIESHMCSQSCTISHLTGKE